MRSWEDSTGLPIGSMAGRSHQKTAAPEDPQHPQTHSQIQEESHLEARDQGATCQPPLTDSYQEILSVKSLKSIILEQF